MAEPIALLLLSTLITLQRIVNQHCSRKRFFTQMAGWFAAVGLFGRRVRKPALPAPTVAVRPEVRAVPRRADSV